MKAPTPSSSRHLPSHFWIILFCAVVVGFSSAPLLADITTTGVVDPASVTTGTVTGESVFIGDSVSTGSLTVDGGSSLQVNNFDNGFGIGMFSNQGNLTISVDYGDQVPQVLLRGEHSALPN